MSILVRPILTDLFTCFTRGLVHVLFAALPRNAISMHGPVAGLLFPRLGRLRSRFAALLDRFHAGTLPPPPAPRAARPRPESAPHPASPDLLTPRQIDLLLRPIPESSWLCRCFLAQIIENDPREAQALVAAAPQAGRILRVYCRMLGLKPPPWLALPRLPARSRSGSASAKAGRRRVRKPRPRPAKPADASKLGRKAFGDFIAPECRDGPSGTRPPNRIGYARGVRLPRDYQPAAKNE